KERLNRGGSKVNVMACENAFYATDMLKKALLENKKAPITEEELDKIGAFPNVAVDRIALSTTVNGVRIPQIQSTFELVIEKDKMVDPAAQPIKGAEYVENLGMYLERKLYVFNCGHAATAYFGYHNGKETIFDALEVPEIKADVIAVMKESAMAMTKKYPFKFEDLVAYIDKIIKRISLEALHDEVVRVGRSPIRKLNAKDRLVGPALLAQQYGLDNSHLAKAIATGYAFDFKEDEQAVEIQNYIAENGIEKAVEKYSGLTEADALYQKVIDAYKAIKA
ncbi:MAG TPA: mannitol dehydrogenase, partial [Megamonas hypermegale]|nr:mannitol dehydrogenase [Megamonas hypermegale]